MKEFDLEKLRIALTYISRMADGRNPATNQQVENEVLDNPNVVRCLHFIRDVLEEVQENHGLVGKKYTRKIIDFPFEVLKEFSYRNDMPISYVLRQFAEPVEGERVRKPNAASVNKWLAANGYIEKRMVEGSRRESWFPLQKGLDIGMYTQKRGDPGYEYVTILYGEKAQQFLADNLQLIVQEIEEMKKESVPKKEENPFTDEE